MGKGVLKGVPGPETIQLTEGNKEKYVRMLLMILIWAYVQKKKRNSLKYLVLKQVAENSVRGSCLV